MIVCSTFLYGQTEPTRPNRELTLVDAIAEMVQHMNNQFYLSEYYKAGQGRYVVKVLNHHTNEEYAYSAVLAELKPVLQVIRNYTTLANGVLKHTFDHAELVRDTERAPDLVWLLRNELPPWRAALIGSFGDAAKPYQNQLVALDLEGLAPLVAWLLEGNSAEEVLACLTP